MHNLVTSPPTVFECFGFFFFLSCTQLLSEDLLSSKAFISLRVRLVIYHSSKQQIPALIRKAVFNADNQLSARARLSPPTCRVPGLKLPEVPETFNREQMTRDREKRMLLVWKIAFMYRVGCTRP